MRHKDKARAAAKNTAKRGNKLDRRSNRRAHAAPDEKLRNHVLLDMWDDILSHLRLQDEITDMYVHIPQKGVDNKTLKEMIVDFAISVIHARGEGVGLDGIISAMEEFDLRKEIHTYLNKVQSSADDLNNAFKQAYRVLGASTMREVEVSNSNIQSLSVKDSDARDHLFEMIRISSLREITTIKAKYDKNPGDSQFAAGVLYLFIQEAAQNVKEYLDMDLGVEYVDEEAVGRIVSFIKEWLSDNGEDMVSDMLDNAEIMGPAFMKDLFDTVDVAV